MPPPQQTLQNVQRRNFLRNNKTATTTAAVAANEKTQLHKQKTETKTIFITQVPQADLFLQSKYTQWTKKWKRIKTSKRNCPQWKADAYMAIVANIKLLMEHGPKKENERDATETNATDITGIKNDEKIDTSETIIKTKKKPKNKRPKKHDYWKQGNSLAE